MGRPIDNQRSLNAAKGLELNLMLTAKKKGFGWMNYHNGMKNLVKTGMNFWKVIHLEKKLSLYIRL